MEIWVSKERRNPLVLRRYVTAFDICFITPSGHFNFFVKIELFLTGSNKCLHYEICNKFSSHVVWALIHYEFNTEKAYFYRLGDSMTLQTVQTVPIWGQNGIASLYNLFVALFARNLLHTYTII